MNWKLSAPGAFTVIAVAIASLTTLALPAAGSRSPTGGPRWEAAAQFRFADAEVDGPSVSINPAGDAVITWQVGAPGPCVDPSACTYSLFAASRRHGEDAWTDPVKIAESWSYIHAPVGLDAAGNGTAVFVEYPKDFAKGGLPRIRAVSFRGGEWEDPVTLAVDRYVADPSVVVSAAGDAFAYWANFNYGGESHWDGAYRSGPRGSWEQPAVIATGAGAFPSVSIDGAGNVLVLFPSATQTSTLIRSVRRSSASKSWSAPATIAETLDARSLVLAVNAKGDAVAMWTTGGYQAVFVQSIYRPASGRWTEPEALSRINEAIYYTSLVIDPAGNALAAWTEEPEQFNRSTWTAFRTASRGRWTPETPLDMSGQIPSLAINSAGDAVAVWGQTPWTGHEVRTSIRPAALGTWGPMESLGVPKIAADVGLDSRGQALVAWPRSEAGFEAVETSELLPNGPILARIRIPRAAERGSAVKFRVSPAPWGSPLKGGPVWSFGDGGHGNGTSVSHVFRRAGRFEVAVTQLDRAGHRSTTSRVLVIRRR